MLNTLSVIAKLKLCLSLRYYQRNWGNAIAVAVIMLVLLAAVLGGAIALFYYVRSNENSVRDTAFMWVVWITTLLWLTAPLTQMDAQNNLDLNGLRLFPLSNSTFSAAALLDGLLSPLGSFLAPISLCLIVVLTLSWAELPWMCLSVLLFAITLLAVTQAVVFFTNHLLHSRRFADASIIISVVLFVIFQSINLLVQQQDHMQPPAWLSNVLGAVAVVFKPIMEGLFPGLAVKAFSNAAAGNMASAITWYVPLAGQAAAALWVAGRAARQFYSGELESGGTVKAKPKMESRRTAAQAPRDVFGALFQRERIYIWRDPLLKMLFIQSMFSMLFITAMLVMNAMNIAEPSDNLPQISNYLVLGAAMMLSFVESGLLFNKFGYEGPLFTAILLSPVDRRRILQAKSVFYLSHFGSLNIVLMITIAIALRAPVLHAICGVLIIACNTAVIDLIGHYVSILYPFTYRRRGRRLRAVMAQPGCGYMLLYMVVFNVCNLAVLPGSASLIAGTILGGAPGLAAGAVIYGVLVYFGYRYLLPHAADLLVRREPELVTLLTRSQQ